VAGLEYGLGMWELGEFLLDVLLELIDVREFRRLCVGVSLAIAGIILVTCATPSRGWRLAASIPIGVAGVGGGVLWEWRSRR